MFKFSNPLIAAGLALSIISCGGGGSGPATPEKMHKFYVAEFDSHASISYFFNIGILNGRMVGIKERTETSNDPLGNLDLNIQVNNGSISGSGDLEFFYRNYSERHTLQVEGTGDENGFSITLSNEQYEFTLVANEPELNGEKHQPNTEYKAGEYISDRGDDTHLVLDDDGDVVIRQDENCVISGFAEFGSDSNIHHFTLSDASAECQLEPSNAGIVLPSMDNSGFDIVYTDSLHVHSYSFEPRTD